MCGRTHTLGRLYLHSLKAYFLCKLWGFTCIRGLVKRLQDWCYILNTDVHTNYKICLPPNTFHLHLHSESLISRDLPWHSGTLSLGVVLSLLPRCSGLMLCPQIAYHLGWISVLGRESSQTGVWIWSRNEGTKLPKEVTNLSSPQKARMSKSMLAVFLDCEGVVDQGSFSFAHHPPRTLLLISRKRWVSYNCRVALTQGLPVVGGEPATSRFTSCLRPYTPHMREFRLRIYKWKMAANWNLWRSNAEELPYVCTKLNKMILNIRFQAQANNSAPVGRQSLIEWTNVPDTFIYFATMLCNVH